MWVLVNVDHQTTCLDGVVFCDNTQTSARGVQQYFIKRAWEDGTEFTTISTCNGGIGDTQTIQVELQGSETLFF